MAGLGEVTGTIVSANQVVLAQVEWPVAGEDLRRNHALNVCQGLCTGCLEQEVLWGM